MLSSPRGENLDTESRFTKSELWELIASQRSAIYQTKNNLLIVALPPLPKLSVKFQRNRLLNVQDITFFSVRPPPKFCLINLFMSSLSPAALTNLLVEIYDFQYWRKHIVLYRRDPLTIHVEKSARFQASYANSCFFLKRLIYSKHK